MENKNFPNELTFAWYYYMYFHSQLNFIICLKHIGLMSEGRRNKRLARARPCSVWQALERSLDIVLNAIYHWRDLSKAIT